MNEIRDRCIRVLADTIEIDPSTITDTSSPDTIDGWDSLAHVQLLLALEKEFSISIPPDVGMEIETVGMMCDLVMQRLSREG